MEMRWRRYINLVALIGVLMHAGMIVRHHEVMLGAHLERQNLISALGVICHGSGQTAAPSDAELPWVPPPSDQQNNQCPLCAGLAAAIATTATAECGVPLRFRTAAPQIVRYEARPVEIASVRPPTRGPPQLA
jgi:hypothetical protein